MPNAGNAGSFINGFMGAFYQAKDMMERKAIMQQQKVESEMRAKMLDRQLKAQEQQDALDKVMMDQLGPQMFSIMKSKDPLAMLITNQLLGVNITPPGQAGQAVQAGTPQNAILESPAMGGGRGMPAFPSFGEYSPTAPGSPPAVPETAGASPVNLQPTPQKPDIMGSPLVRGFLEKNYGMKGSTRTELDETTGKVYKYDVDAFGKEIPNSRTLTDMKNFNQEAQNRQFQQESDLRTKYTTESQKFVDIRDAFQNMQQFAGVGTAAGDQAMIYSYMKMLDPGSTVREGEFANAKNAAGVPDKIRVMYNSAKDGTILTPAMRRDFLNQTEEIYKVQLGTQVRRMEKYRRLASSYGLNPKNVIMDLADGVSVAPPVQQKKAEYVYVPGKGLVLQPGR